MDTKTLVDLAEAYSAHTGLKLSTVSTYAATDGKFFGRLKTGAGCTLRKAATLVVWFSENWPEDLAWPAEVPRPTASERSGRAA
jgi:hypothetical protein